MSATELTSRFPLLTSRVNVATLSIIEECFECDDSFSVPAAPRSFKIMESILSKDSAATLKSITRLEICELSFFCMKLIESKDPIASTIALHAMKTLTMHMRSALK